MKVLAKYIAIVLTIGVFISCNDFLDVSQESQVSLSEFWGSQDQVEAGVAAIYDAAQTAFEQNYYIWGEVRADNYIQSDRVPASYARWLENGLTPNTSGSNWSSLYSAIASANVAIANIPNAPDFDGKDDLLGQARALRALFYFYAVRVWGDVPMITEPTTSLDQELNKPRTSSETIFSDVIIPDLQEAEQLISSNNQESRRISLAAILAIRAHLYAWPSSNQDYTKVRDAIARIENMNYGLETTQSGWINLFQGSQNSDEIIFALNWNFNEDGGNAGIGLFIGATPFLVPPERVEQKWKNYIPEDFRRLTTAAYEVEIISETEFPLFRVLTKYSGRFENRDVQGAWAGSNDRDIIFYRLSGLLLLKAEAQNYLGNPGKALALINRVRRARELTQVDETITDQETIRNMILNDRQFELMVEGHRYWDLVRNEVVLDVMGPINGMSDPAKILWPISQDVLDKNPELTQNEGY